ncbi:MAG: tRNA guanosine(15) transglycosylase TgtA [Salinirussus sp.]
MTGGFEVRRYDAAGRRGELSIPRAGVTVDTPALLPVVNPHIQTLPPADMAETFGIELLITNAYILHGSDELREPALERGVHELLEFDGAIMTDSGSFQLAEYGDLDIDTAEILAFQDEIGADIGTPVDIPTPPDADRERAEREQRETQNRLELAANLDVGDMLVSAPIQGAMYTDLREHAASEAASTGLDLYPIGAVVPLLENYRFADLVDVVLAAKRGLPESAPVHLFGAGHPMMFALAAAMGCDLFDSAAYARYAKDNRYLTVRGTAHLEDLDTLPCPCPICTEWSAADLQAADTDTAADRLARHNLHVSVAELRNVRQAIRRGNLLELLEARARSHPSVLSAYRRLLESVDRLEATDPVTKDAFFYLSTESADRPEVRRHHDRLKRLEPRGDLLLTEGSGQSGYDEIWRLVPPFGPVPPELSDAYPLTAEVPDRPDHAAMLRAAEGVAALADTTSEVHLTVAHADWDDRALAALPDDIETITLEGSQ